MRIDRVPRALSAIPGHSLTLTWSDHTAGRASMTLERRLGLDGTYAALATVAPGVTTYTDQAVSAGVIYCYRAFAITDAGRSDYSNEACNATVLPPTTVTLTVTVEGPGKVTSNPAGINGCPGGSTCVASFPSGEIVALVATPNNRNHTFERWSGAAAGCPATCVMRLDTATSAGVGFRRQ